MIHLSIALNSQGKKAGVMRMLHGQINEVPSHANLTFSLKSSPLKNSLDLNLERRVTLFAGGLASISQNATLGVFQEQVKIADSTPFAINKDLVAAN